MLILGQGKDDLILMVFWITILDVSHNMWGNKLLSGSLRSLSSFLVADMSDTDRVLIGPLKHPHMSHIT